MMVMIYPWLENQAGDDDDDSVLRKINPDIIIIQVILGQVADYFIPFLFRLFQGNLMFRSLLLNPVAAAMQHTMDGHLIGNFKN